MMPHLNASVPDLERYPDHSLPFYAKKNLMEIGQVPVLDQVETWKTALMSNLTIIVPEGKLEACEGCFDDETEEERLARIDKEYEVDENEEDI